MLSRTVNDRAATAERLLQSSLDHSCEPGIDVDLCRVARIGLWFEIILMRMLLRHGVPDDAPRRVTHVTEQARHVRYTREELLRRMLHPDVYQSVGIDPDVGRRAALANPHWQETSRWSVPRLVPFLREQELIEGTWEFLWRRARLV